MAHPRAGDGTEAERLLAQAAGEAVALPWLTAAGMLREGPL